MGARMDFYRWFEKQPKDFRDSFVNSDNNIFDAGCMVFSQLAKERVAEETGDGSLQRILARIRALLPTVKGSAK